MAEPIALAKAGDHKPRGIGRLSLGLQVVCALLLGILSGLFFGELMLKIAFIGEIYIGLLQMMVLPYIIISLLSGIGKLSLGQAMQLAKYAILVLFLMWFVIGAVLMVLPLALPELTSASFFSTSLVNQAEPVKFIDIFVPKNIFASLSNNQVPAVVIFCLALGIALITASSKDAVFKLLDVLGDAVIRVIKFVVTLSPVGVFAMTATAAGTMSFEELGRLQGYFILYTLAVLLLAGVILPGLIACLTPFSYRDVLSAVLPALALSFAAAKTLVALPLVIEGVRTLFTKYRAEDPQAVSVAEMLVPIAYPFPATGKLLSLLFIPFIAWYLGQPLPLSDYPLFLGSGLMSLFGSVPVAIPFILDLMRLPSDTFELFLLTGVYSGRLSDALGAMDLFTFAALVASASSGLVSLRWYRLMALLAGFLVILTLIILGVRNYLGLVSLEVYNKDTVIRSMQLLGPTVSAIRVEPAPNPVVLAQGQSRLERIKQRGVIRVGYHPDRLPFSYINTVDKLVGLDIEMAHKLAVALNVSIEFVPFRFSTFKQQLDDDHFDVAMAGFYGTAQQSEQLRFSDPYLFATMALVVPDHRDQVFASAQSIRRQGTLRVAIHTSLANEEITQLVQQDYPNMEMVEIEDYRDFFQPGEAETRLDALFTGAESGSAWTLLYPQFQVVTPWASRYRIPLVYPFGGTDPVMDEFIDHWVMLKQNDNALQQVYDYWILGQGSEFKRPRWSVIRDVLGWID